MKRTCPWYIYVVYIAFFAATNWPVLKVVNLIEPRIGPMPFLVAWMIIWSIGIGVFHMWYGLTRLQDPRIPEREEPAELPASPMTAEEEGA